MSRPLNVLIIGAGCGGPAVTYWLTLAGHRCTIVERAPTLRSSGAQIDLRAQGIQLVRRMGLIDTIRARTVDEDGMAMVDTNGIAWASILANKSGKGAQNFSSEFEIMRGDLVTIFYEATKDKVEYVFGKSVERFEQDEEGVDVWFDDGVRGRYDIVVGADGQGSRTRKAILSKEVDPLRRLNLYMAHWRVPITALDKGYDKTAKLCLAPGGRWVMTRTHSPTEGQAYFFLRTSEPSFQSIPKASRATQQQFWAQKFADIGYCVPQLIKGMQTSDYFYCQEVVQVRAPTWSKGRVVLLADAAHCPSPMTGMGTTCALVGSYVLAGSILENSEDPVKAFGEYEKVLRPFVEECQSLPGWLLPLSMPHSSWAIALLQWTAWILCTLRVPELLTRFVGEEKAGFTLPEYPMLNKATPKQEQGREAPGGKLEEHRKK